MKVYLGDLPVELTGKRPKNGSKWKKDFQLTPVLNTDSKFPNLRRRRGIFFISTLPNVRSFACSAQVLDLEVEIKKRKISAKIIHLASDGKDSWNEIKKLHPQLKALGYSLKDCDQNEINILKTMLGVGVVSSNRLAHGLFVIKDGMIISSLIPKQQYGTPNIKRFLNKLQSSEHFNKT
ncbi:hypothetical protein ND856_08875 [Leptospira bandrabouensis]|uniref:hypothetical protein n=1 Tax=Leptospira bandrabouensis TaxID=2484903 RepID=UPI00223E0645|nr:hypothetical protein [Leptospira bandrabouensis]MCW7457865.1 hypothetical protein [Leptospira bandrabouensis]MCW7477395.1 hypothetical protein [Leptospira bandrabouensis]MCW7485077.1 hypothetical protein [Leptospira bandrabouensis]